MDHATLSALATGVLAFALGVLIDRLFQRRLRQTLAARDNTIDAHAERIASQSNELRRLGDRCSELRIENGRVKADNVRLAPLAEIGRRRAASIAKDAERKRAKRKASGNVTPITSPPGRIIAA